MKRSLSLALICLVLAMTPAFGEVKAGPHWTGVLDTSSWYLDNLNDFSDDTGDQMAFMKTYFNLNMEMNLEDGIDLVFGLKIEQILGSDGYNLFEDTLAVRKAYVHFHNFLIQPISLVVGRQVDAYALRGDESKGSFMFDSNWISNSEGVDGFKVILNNDNFIANFFMYNYAETTTNAATNSGIEGFIAGDNAVMGAQATLDLNAGQTSIYGLLLVDRRGGPSAVIGDNDRVASNIISLDIGATWDISDSMFLYGQVASNLMGHHWVDGEVIADGLVQDDERNTVKGLAAQIGMEFQFGAYGAWFQFDYATGDDPGTEDYEGFLAPAESQELLYIIEGQRMLNRNSNYTAIRVGGTWSMRGDLELGLTIGVVSEVEDTVAMVGAGMEFDLTVEWEYSDNVILSALVGGYMPDSDSALGDDMVVAGMGKVSVSF